MAQRPRIGLILTGGTTDSVGADRLDLTWYFETAKRLGAGELMGRLPELAAYAAVEEIAFRAVSSQALVDKDWLDLNRKVHEIFEQDRADGIVAADNLQPWKARILLSLALTKTANADDIQTMFDTY